MNNETKEEYYSLYHWVCQYNYILANSIHDLVYSNDNMSGAEEYLQAEQEYLMEGFASETIDGMLFDNEELVRIQNDNGNITISELLCMDISEEAKNEIYEIEQSYTCDGVEVYQWFLFDNEDFYEILKDYGDFVYWSEEAGVYFWGVTHYGTHWSCIQGHQFPVQNEYKYKK